MLQKALEELDNLKMTASFLKEDIENLEYELKQKAVYYKNRIKTSKAMDKIKNIENDVEGLK